MIKTYHCDIRLELDENGFENVRFRCRNERNSLILGVVGEATLSVDTETKNVGVALTHPNDRFVRTIGFQKSTGRCEASNKRGMKSAFNGPAKVNRFGISLNLHEMAKNFVESLDKQNLKCYIENRFYSNVIRKNRVA